MYPSSVAPSRSGSGLIASENLPEGVAVEKYEGAVMQYEEVPSDEIPYVLRLKNGQWMVPRSNARFINYSCDPNCQITDNLEVVTRRPVVQGEELTVSHRKMTMEEYLEGKRETFVWDDRWTLQCRCGSSNCIKLVDRYLVESPDDPNSLKIRVGITGAKGRGVFATGKIRKDEIIERAPIVLIPEQQWDMVESTTLRNYTFSWGPNDEHAAVALGYVSLYNHSYTPNAMFVQTPEDAVIEITALRDIEKGEEILVNYNGEPDDQEPLWFTAV